MTDGTDHAMFYVSGGARSAINLNLDIPRGSSVGVKIDVNTSGGANVYVALITHLRDGNLD